MAVGLCHTTFHFPETTDINQITGVVTNGLFARRSADVLLLGRKTGIERIE